MPDRSPGDFEIVVPKPARWYRLVPSRYPPVQLWDRVASPDELNAVAAVEGYTNTRIMAELGDHSMVPQRDWLFGQGASPVMAAFCHANPQGSRFSAGEYGVYYAADSVEAAAREVCYHRQRWYRENGLSARTDTLRCYIGSVVKELTDIRDEPAPRILHNPDSWDASRKFGASCRRDGRWGIYYESVRAPGSECVALLRPPASSPVIQGCHLRVDWDGHEITGWERVEA